MKLLCIIMWWENNILNILNPRSAISALWNRSTKRRGHCILNSLLHYTSPNLLIRRIMNVSKRKKITLDVWVNKISTFSLFLKSVRELLIFIPSGFRQVIFKKPEDFIIFCNGVMEINLQVTVKAFMPSVCHDYSYSPAAQDYSLKWNWKVHTKVLSYKVTSYHTKTHKQPSIGKVSAIKITARYRFIAEEPCACSYPANAKEIMQALNYPVVVFMLSSVKSIWCPPPGSADEGNSLSTAAPVLTSIHSVLLQVLARVVKEGAIAVDNDK